ncbi:hypothetical protein L6452_37328 [Arctium lappa]|uniref:Uncharacterized protein n=1 Tax=Arctium lappa TaxID=4217 RepID=A0ACB8Y3U0_ARCLA|nr:hypothetical protein L6452_37328 [Arctium lappa]
MNCIRRSKNFIDPTVTKSTKVAAVNLKLYHRRRIISKKSNINCRLQPASTPAHLLLFPSPLLFIYSHTNTNTLCCVFLQIQILLKREFC